MKLFYLLILGLINTGFSLMCYECEFMRIQNPGSNKTGNECQDPGENFLKRCENNEKFCRTIISSIEPIGISQVFRGCSQIRESGECRSSGVFSTTVCRRTCSTDRCNSGNLTQTRNGSDDDDENDATRPYLHHALVFIAVLAVIL